MKRRGINLKAIEDSDPGLVELLTSDLCQRDTEEAEAFDPYRDDVEPTLGDVVDEVQEALEDALEFLHEGLSGAGTAAPDPREHPAGESPAAAPRRGAQLPFDFE